MNLPIMIPVNFIDTPEHKKTIEYGRYLVVRKDGKKHMEVWNNVCWAYNHNSIVAYYLPPIG